MRTQTANIRYDLLESIQNEAKVPLVIHGPTGLPYSARLSQDARLPRAQGQYRNSAQGGV
ncbi:MAG: hypothetical protein ACLTW9_05575 [Enterocloster sp.]